jgi:hypothetical protein
MLTSRRRVLTGAASLALTVASAPALAAMGPGDKFDLVIKSGDVLDPSQALRGRRDIGIRYGVIEAVEPDIPAAKALRCHRCRRQAGDAWPRRPALPRLPLWLRDRDSCG